MEAFCLSVGLSATDGGVAPKPETTTSIIVVATLIHNIMIVAIAVDVVITIM